MLHLKYSLTQPSHGYITLRFPTVSFKQQITTISLLAFSTRINACEGKWSALSRSSGVTRSSAHEENTVCLFVLARRLTVVLFHKSRSAFTSYCMDVMYCSHLVGSSSGRGFCWSHLINFSADGAVQQSNSEQCSLNTCQVQEMPSVVSL